MKLIVGMKGALQPYVIEEADMESVMHKLNLAATQGKQFVFVSRPDGADGLLNLGEILSLFPTDEEEGLIA